MSLEDLLACIPLVLLIKALHFPLGYLLLKRFHLSLLLQALLRMQLVCILCLALNSLSEVGILVAFG